MEQASSDNEADRTYHSSSLCALIQQLKYSLVGFCDASAKAYAAVVYLRTEQETHADTHILASKTHVTLLGDTTTIPRLELLSALLLAKLVMAVETALHCQKWSVNIPVYE